jgi:hypothetical protein
MVRNLSENKIQTLKGLNRLPNLQILHFDRQRIKRPVTFDLETMEALGTSLKSFTMSKCQLAFIEPLSVLFELESLDLTLNQLDKIEVSFL